MNSKVFWILIVLVLLGGATYAAWPEIKKLTGKGGGSAGNGGTGTGGNGNTGSAGGNGGNSSTGSGGGYQTFNMNATLKLNVYDSKEVKELQRMLNKLETSNKIAEDGDFGPLTQAKLTRVWGSGSTTLAQFKAVYPFA